MKHTLRRFPFTSAVVAFAVMFVLAVSIGNIDLIQVPISALSRFEQEQFYEAVTLFVLVIVALVVDNILAARRRQREAKRQVEQYEAGQQAERLRVVHVTMRTVQDIVNNCLNQLQLFRLDAAEGLVSEESLRLFDETIREAFTKLVALGNLKVFSEKRMAVGSGLEVSESPIPPGPTSG